MLRDARSDCARGVWVREDNGEPVRFVRSYDTETGEYTAFRLDPDVARKNGLDPARLLYRGRARLRFVQSGVAAARAVGPPPELRRRRGVRCLMLPDRECEEPKCHAVACWGVLDAQEVAPDAQGFRRHRAANTRYYCERHYRFPTVTSLRGVTAEV